MIIKRLSALFLVIALLSGSVPAHALVPVGAGIVESALASYVSSAGLKWIFSEGQTADGAARQITDLWGDFRSQSSGVSALEDYADGIYVSDRGQYVVSWFAMSQFQNFAHWLVRQFGISAGGTSTIYSGGRTINGKAVYTATNTYTVSQPWNNAPIVGAYSGQPVRFGMSYNGTFSGYVWRTSAGQIGALSTVSGASMTFWGAGFDITRGFSAATRVNLSGHYYYYQLWDVSPWFPTSALTAIPLADITITTGTSLGTSDSLSVEAGQSISIPGEAAAEDDVAVISPGIAVPDIVTPAGVAADTWAGLIAGDIAPATTITPAIDAPVALPQLGDYALSDLGAALTDVFPFCIPWDVAEIIGALNATPQAPYFSVDLFGWLRAMRPDLGDTDFTLDLGQPQYAPIGTVCRWATTITFCLGLLFATKRLIWTTGG